LIHKLFYEASELGVEIVLTPLTGPMMGYMKESHGPWWALEHNSDIGHQISSKYSKREIVYFVF
jgi:hypothetical protein